MAIVLLSPTGCSRKPAVENQQRPPVDSRLLIDAAKGGDSKALTQLLDAGGSVEAKNESGRTLVALAALRGNTPIVKLLLDRGANPNARDSEGMTPLMWAAFGGSLESVKALLGKGADPNVRANDGKTVLDWLRPGDEKLARLLRGR